jgi:eukaryotic-like serine/threonine-protein kinase
MGLPVVGEVFAGKYAIEAVVGRGGMGVVLAARHLELDERVAIKLILGEGELTTPEVLTRFVREAKLASKIKSEHVVRIIDVARRETGEPYIVMELLEGQDLAELLARNGPLPVDQVALYVLQACEAVAEAHTLGIVHRDLKPANLFLTTLRDGRPCVKVLDFGISKLVGEHGSTSMTKTNALVGSPLYMSPDQLTMGRDLDARSDVWSLGVILFELLTGRGPFDGADAPQLIAQILLAQPPSLLSLRPDAPPELAALIEAALMKDREQRLPNVAELSRGLAAFVPDLGRFSLQRIDGLMARSGSLSASNAPVQARTAPTRGTSAGTAGGAALDLGTARRSSSVVPVVAVLGGLLAMAGAAAFVWLHRVPASAAAPAAPLAATLPPLVSAALSPSPRASEAPNVAAASAPAPETPSEAAATAPTVAGKPNAAGVPHRAAAGAHPKPPANPSAGTPADPFGGVR